MDIEKEPSRFQKAARFLNSQPGVHLMLVLVLLVGAYFRLLGVNWDANQHQQPDERFMTIVAEQIHSVARLSDYFDPETSTLNPLSYGFYTYGMLPLFLTRYVAEGIARTGYDEIVLVGRVLSAVFDLAAGLMLYLLGGRLYGRWTGLLATALYATAVLPIQLSHFFAVDSFTTLFMLAAFYAAVMIMERPSLSAFVLFGITNGLALATKVSIAPLALIAVFASVAHLAAVWSDAAQRLRGVRHIIVGLLFAGLCSGILFRLFQPYAFAGPGVFGLSINPSWLEIMGEVTAQVTGRVDYPPNYHWIGRSWSYAWSNLVRWGMGLPLGLTATAAWFWAAWRILRGQWRQHLLPVLWVGGYFLWQNSYFWRYNRYFLPVYPLATLLAACMLLNVLQWAGQRTPRPPRLPSWRRLLLRPLSLAGLLLAGVLLGTTLYAYAFSRIYTRPHTRVAATEWLRQQVPGPLNVIMETADGRQRIPLPVPYEQLFNPGDRWSINFKPPQDGRLLAVSAPAVEKGASPAQSVDVEWSIIPLESDLSRPVQQTTRVNFAEIGRAVTQEVLFPDTTLRAGENYELAFLVLDGAPVVFGHESIAVESSWDDALPLRTPGFDPYRGVYRQLDLGLFEPDTAEKRRRLNEMLAEADYLVVASNRVYDAAPRMPHRYPLTLAYYQALFACDSVQITRCAYPARPGLASELGFELAAVFESYPTLGPLSFPDQSAMESFTVYDHPKVFIFQKRPDFSPDEATRLLEAVDLP